MIFEEAKRILEEALNGAIPISEETAFLQDHELVEAVIDAAWLSDLTLDPSTPTFTNLAAFIHTAAATNPHFSTLALKRLDARLLEAAGLIESAAILNKRQVRANTAMFYKQAKYNAHQEETEGWARMFEVLAKGSGSQEDLVKRVLQLVGLFALDPNRVVDCVVDAMVCAVELAGPCEQLVQLLRSLSLPSARIMEIMALKLCDNPTFWTVIAILIEHGIVLFEDVLGYLDKDLYTSNDSFAVAVKKLPMASDPFGFHDITSCILNTVTTTTDRRVLLFTAFLKTKQMLYAGNMLNMFGELHVDHAPSWHVMCDLLLEMPSSDPLFAFWLHKFSKFLFVNIGLCVKLAQCLTVEDLVGILFPILPFLPPLPILHHAIYGRLCGIPHEHRFRILQRLTTDAAVGRVHAQDVKRVMRRVSKENVKQSGRLLGKLLSMAPMLVCGIIIDQIKAYDNMIIPLVDTLRFASPLAMDCLLAALLHQLTSVERSRVKEDGVHVAGWLQRVALFMAHLSKKYAVVDISAIIAVLTDRLCKNHADELPCLTELFKHIGGVEVTTSTVNERALEVSFGGPVLRESAGYLQDSPLNGNPLESRIRLVNALKAQPECRLWRLLALQPTIQVRQREYDAQEVKVQSHAFDTAFEAFFMYTTFVGNETDVDLVCGLPDLRGLCGEGIEPYIASLMLRTRRLVCGDSNHPVPLQFDDMTVRDIYTPITRYEQEIGRLKVIACSPQAKPHEKERALNFVLHLERELGESVKRTSLVVVVDAPVDALLCRAIMTPTEAVFCAEYLEKLDGFLDAVCCIIDKLADLLFAFSEREATCFGRFLSLCLPTDKLTVAQHLKIFAAFNCALTTPAFIPIRNAVLCLTKLGESTFPRHRQIAIALEQRCRLLHDTDSREDVRVLSTRCRALMAAIAVRVSAVDIELDGGQVDVDGLAETFAEITSLNSSVVGSSVAGSPAVVSGADLEDGEHAPIEPSSPVVVPRETRDQRDQRDQREPRETRESPNRKRKIEDIITEEDTNRKRANYGGSTREHDRDRDRDRDRRDRGRDKDKEKEKDREKEKEKEKEREREREKEKEREREKEKERENERERERERERRRRETSRERHHSSRSDRRRRDDYR